MANMILATKLKVGVNFEHKKKPFRVIDYKHTHMSRGGGTVKIKAKNLLEGGVLALTFKSTEKIEDIDVNKKTFQYLYKENDNFVFMDPVSFEQIEIEEKIIGKEAVYLKEGEEVELLMWDDNILGLQLPPKVVLKVAEADPGEKGDSASNVMKQAKLENGMKMKVPLFVNKGDRVRVDTQTGEYVDRV